jgi:hypothetical protein
MGSLHRQQFSSLSHFSVNIRESLPPKQLNKISFYPGTLEKSLDLRHMDCYGNSYQLVEEKRIV